MHSPSPARSGQASRTLWYLGGVLLTLAAMLGMTACATRAELSTEAGASGPVAWQVTDFRLVERSLDGTGRDFYAFTLVLNETQGTTLTFRHLVSRLRHPSIATVPQQASVRWTLRPHGELRHPFIFPWCTTEACKQGANVAPWVYDLLLLGTDERGRPLRVVINTTLPARPIPPPPSTTALPDAVSGPVPFETVNNHIVVHALLNQQEAVRLVLDTGAWQTFVTPATAQRLSMSPASHAPTYTTTVVGGRQVQVPVVSLASLAVGQTMRANVPVGVLASFPRAPLFDGILGGSFLAHFTLTLDYPGSRLWLVPHGAPLPPPTAVTMEHRAIPIAPVNNYILVRAVLNHTAPASLLLDTGASHTMVTPRIAQRLGIAVTADTPRGTIMVADGQRQEVPLVNLAALQVGHVTVSRLTVAVLDLLPQASTVDGLLGVDVLGQFVVTLDRAGQQMWLASPSQP
jgi:predicted aspartyl protease